MPRSAALVLALAWCAAAGAAGPGVAEKSWRVGGVARKALVHIPANTTGAAPVVFASHGHGGSMSAEGTSWVKSGSLVGTQYPSKTGAQFVSVIHPGAHKFPDEAPALIVKFFREHARP